MTATFIFLSVIVGVAFFFTQGRRDERFTGQNSGSVISKALPIIKHFEGFFADAYTCPGGKLTIGYGHLVKPGESHHITKPAAIELLKSELSNTYFPSTKSALEGRGFDVQAMTTSQLASMVSATYNLGPDVINKGSWVEHWQNNKRTTAADWFYRWSKASGVRLEGLVRRRFAEWQMFQTGSWNQNPIGYHNWYEEHK